MAAKGGAAKDGAGEVMSAADMKPLLKLSRRRPVSCVVAMTKDKQGVVLLHRRKKPRKLMAELRRQAAAAGMELNAASIRFGRAAVDGASDSALVRFTVNKPAPGAIRMALLERLRPAGFQRCEIAVDEALETEAEDGEDEDTDDEDGAGDAAPGAADAAVPAPNAAAMIDGASSAAGGSGAATPVLAGAAGVARHGSAPSQPGAPLPAAAGPAGDANQPVPAEHGAADGMAVPSAAALRARLTGLVRRTVGAVASNSPGSDALRTAATGAGEALASGDLAAAGQAVDALERLLGGVPTGSLPACSPAAAAASGTPAPSITMPDAPAPGGSGMGQGDAGQSGTGQGDTSQGSIVNAAVLTADLTDLARQIAPAIAADPSCRAPLVKLANEAHACVKAGDIQAATAGVEKLRQALPAAAAAGGSAGAGRAAVTQGDVPARNGPVPDGGKGVKGPIHLPSAQAGGDELAIPVADTHGGTEREPVRSKDAGDAPPQAPAGGRGRLGPGGRGTGAIPRPVQHAAPGSPVPAAPNALERAWNSTKEGAAAVGSAIGEFDASHGHVLTRTAGAAQAVGATVEGVAGAAMAGVGAVATPTGVGTAPGLAAVAGGVALMGNAADNAWAGLQTAWTGQFHHTVTARVAGGAARHMGASEQTAERITDGMDLAQGVAGGIGGLAAGRGLAQREAATAVRATEQAAARKAAEEAVVRKAAEEAAAKKAAAETAAKKTADAASENLVDELVKNGVKVSPADVVAIGRTAAGQVVFVEKGNAAAGLRHIVERHGAEFAQAGISQDKIPGFLIEALRSGRVVGQQGRGGGRIIYELTFEGKTVQVAITTGNNGFVVGANMR